jgi:two-component system cell cycle sensor histidine kinase/response regulator CckA
VMHPDDRENMKGALARMEADPSGRRPPTSVRIQNRSGEWLPFDVTGQLVPQEGAAGATMVCSIRDMAAQRQLEAALLQRSRMDSLGRMAGSIAHDFNNMLTVIKGGLDLALEDVPADSRSRQDLDTVRTAAMRGEALTRQLLTFARQRPPTSEQFDVRDRLASLEGVVAMAVGRAIRIRTVRSDQALLVRADPDQFDQVIMNLAINARDAMPSGGELTIQSMVSTVNGMGEAPEPMAATAWARVVVEDTGVGIPAANIHRIFEPFFTTKAEGHGNGLGLASAYGFARQAGGRVSVESTEGVGTRFFLDLPLDSPDTA